MTTSTQQPDTKPDSDRPLAERLLEAGIPVVVCTPNSRYGEPGQPELFPPTGWNTITVEQARLDFLSYRPGIDTLAMVAGHGIDVLDIDTKVAGVKLEDVPHGIDMDNGITVTPSQGFHIPVRSTGYSSGSLYFNSKYVGDYCGGTKGGGGRKLVYLPGSHRPKYPDNVYVMAKDWDIDKILDSFTDDLLVTCLEACPGLSDTGHAGAPMAERHDIDGFLAEHSEVADCKYGQAAIYGDSLLGNPGLLDLTPDFGDQDNGLHAWITRTVNRATELVKSGCLDASVYSDIEQRVKELATQHHEPNRYRIQEVTDCLAWAITNVSDESGCKKHDASLTVAAPGTLPSDTDDTTDGDIDLPTDPNDPMGFLRWDALFTADHSDEYLIPHFLCKGQSCVLYANAGTGKSLLAFEWAVQLAMGGAIFDQNLHEHSVLYVDHENPLSSIRDRLESMGFDSAPDQLKQNLHYSSMGNWMPLDTKEGGDQLLQWALKFDADIVFIDTTAMSTVGPENEANTYTDFAKYTTRALKAKGIAVVRIDHAGKDKERGQRGSSAKSADVDLVYRLDKETDVVYALTREKNRPGLSGDEKIRVRRLSDPLKHEIIYTNPKHEDTINGIIKDLDRFGMPLDVSRRKAHAELKANGITCKTVNLAEALKRRKSARLPLPTLSNLLEQ